MSRRETTRPRIEQTEHATSTISPLSSRAEVILKSAWLLWKAVRVSEKASAGKWMDKESILMLGEAMFPLLALCCKLAIFKHTEKQVPLMTTVIFRLPKCFLWITKHRRPCNRVAALALNTASLHGSFEMAKMLKEQYFLSVDDLLHNDGLPFIYAVQDGHLDIAQWLYSEFVCHDLQNFGPFIDKAFVHACKLLQLGTAQWLYSTCYTGDNRSDAKETMKETFFGLTWIGERAVDMVKWILEELEYFSVSPSKYEHSDDVLKEVFQGLAFMGDLGLMTEFVVRNHWGKANMLECTKTLGNLAELGQLEVLRWLCDFVNINGHHDAKLLTDLFLDACNSVEDTLGVVKWLALDALRLTDDEESDQRLLVEGLRYAENLDAESEVSHWLRKQYGMQSTVSYLDEME